MTVQFELSTDSDFDFPRNGTSNLEDQSDSILRFAYFNREILFSVGDVEFVGGGRCALLDFMSVLIFSLDEIWSTGAGSVDFAENSRVIAIKGSGDVIEFSTSSGEVAQCTRSEYANAVYDFTSKGVQDLLEKYPVIIDKPSVRSLLEAVSNRNPGTHGTEPFPT